MFQRRLRASLAAILFCCALPSFARVISYAPYSDRISFTGIQHRLNRHFAVVEGPSQTYVGPMISPLPYWNGYPYGQVIVYDFEGQDELRVVFPQDGTL